MTPKPKHAGGRPRTPRLSTEHVETLTGKQFTEALHQLDMTPDTFAKRCGVHRATIFRQIAEDRIPAWAAWLIALLIERRQLSDRLARPAE